MARDPFFTQQVDYTPDDYSGYIDFYGGALDSDIDVQVIDEPEEKEEDKQETETVLDVLDPVESDEDRPRPQATQYTFGSAGKTPKYDTKVYGAEAVNSNFNTGFTRGDKSDNFAKKGLRDKFGITITADYATESALAPLNLITGVPLASTIAGTLIGDTQEAPFATEEGGTRQFAPAGGLGRFALDIANSFHVKNAAAVTNSLLEGGGTAGALMSINGMRVSRAPGSFQYTGNLLGLDRSQVIALEGTNYGFIGGFTEEFDEATGTYKRTGTKGLMSEVSGDGGVAARANGGDYNFETGSYTDSLGNTFGGGMKSDAVAAIAQINKKFDSNLSWTEIAATRKQVQTDIFGNLKPNTPSFIELLKEKAKANAALSSTAQIAGVKPPKSADEIIQTVTPTTKDGPVTDSGKFMSEYLQDQDKDNFAANREAERQEKAREAQERATKAAAQKRAEDREAERQKRTRQAQERAEAAAAEQQRQERIAAERRSYAQGQARQDPEKDEPRGVSEGSFGSGGFGDSGRFRARGGLVGYASGGVAAAPAGFVERPPSQVSEAATVADDKPMSVPEGTFVINAAAVEFAGEQDIVDMLNEAYRKAEKKGIQPPTKETLDVAVSKGEVIVPPFLAKIIGYDRLEKINNRGKAEVNRRIKNADTRQNPRPMFLGGIVEAIFGKKEDEPKTETFLAPSPNEDKTPVKKDLTPTEGFIKKSTPPSTPLPKRTDFENTAYELLELLEGNRTEGYVPKVNRRSGVTVGIGFDLGQHNPTDLEKMGINTNLIAKLTPYLKKKGKAAESVLEYEPLSLTEREVQDLNTIVLRKKYEEFAEKYPEYAKLPDAGKRAVLFSTSYLGAIGRYKAFREEFNKAKNIKQAIKKGLLGKISKGDAEYNRAKKALKWYEGYETKTMRVPKPKPNSSATR